MGAPMRYQPQGLARINPYWVKRGLAFAWVASAPASNLANVGSTDVRVGSLTFAASPRGIAASGFSSPNNSNRLISDPRITGFSGVGTFIGGGICSGGGSLLSIGQTGQGVRVGVKNGIAGLTYLGIADYYGTLSVPNGPVVVGASINNRSALVLAKTASGVAAQTFSIGTVAATSQPLRMGSTGTGDEWLGAEEFGYYFTQPLSADELALLVNNPWALFDSGSSSSAYQAAIASAAPAGSGTTTNVTPSAGALTIAGYAPSVAQSANRSVAPAAGGLSLTGYAPTISQPISVVPGAGSIALTGYAPQVQQSVNSAVSPGTAALTLVGYAPSVSQSSITSVAPQPGALALTGFAPDVAQSANASVAPGAAAISITGFAPAVVQAGSIALTLGAAPLSIVGYPPTVSQSGAGGGAPGYGKARRKYVVRKGDSLYSFSDPQAAKAFLHADDEPAPVKQYPAKKQAKAAPAPAPKREPDPVPEQRVDLAEVRALAAKQHAEAEYQRLLARQQYETLLTLLERLREEEEDDWLLIAAD